MDEMELVQQSQRKDREAFNQLVLKYQDTLYNAVYRMAGNSADALDICQESFIRAYLNIKRFKGKSSFQTWLYQIALNQFYTHHKKTKKDKERKADYHQMHSSEPKKPGDTSTNPVQPLQAQEQKEVVQSALNSLPPDLRKVVVLKDIEGFSYEEIARVIKKSVSIVRRRLGEARLQLCEALKEYL